MAVRSVFRRILTSNWLPLLVVGFLYLTGLHTPVIALLQRGILATGLFQPATDLPTTYTPGGPVSTTTLDFRMVDPAGQVVNASELTGKVVFLNLWASWCAPCLAEMPNIHALWQDYAEDDRIAFVLLNTEDELTKGLAYVGRHGYGFPVYRLLGGLPEELRTGTLPTTYVISPAGQVVLEHRGMGQYDTRKVRDLLDRLLNDRVSR
ncbi:Thiol-disulfide oxidoreductase ResA [Neolewinella maritima]|uniref:Thiol-disulfide oxidoreductase ResA n=1 Tax=Neolewinella maritima TaxID=1383882 RepID=A0ABN8EZZ7_9BACT|nr:TlpA disulfide reductase family protein [Neolewinella maritima]CAH0999065.1 Thiol-disulfide oxidoreductase ResA [Neolewinella maritima]